MPDAAIELTTDPKIFEKGSPVLMLAGPRSITIEAWVKAIAEESGERVDWRLVGDRAILLVLDDESVRTKVRALTVSRLDSLRDAYMACTSNFTKNPQRDDVQWGEM